MHQDISDSVTSAWLKCSPPSIARLAPEIQSLPSPQYEEEDEEEEEDEIKVEGRSAYAST